MPPIVWLRAPGRALGPIVGSPALGVAAISLNLLEARPAFVLGRYFNACRYPLNLAVLMLGVRRHDRGGVAIHHPVSIHGPHLNRLVCTVATMLRGREVVIVDAVRTAIGRGHPKNGAFRAVHPNELLGSCFTALIDRSGLDPGRVGDVIAGCVTQRGEQAINIARNAWLQAGLPLEVPGTTVDRQCGSGQQAVAFAAALIASGIVDVAIGGGVEHMSRLPLSLEADADDELGTPWPQPLLDRYELVPQGISAELLAEQWEVSRHELDELSLRSHRLASRAIQAGKFDAEIVEVAGVGRDQGVRPDTSLEALRRLPSAFREGGKVTAGNSSQISDGAAAVLLCESTQASKLGLRPRARVVDQVTVGVDPVSMLLGPVPATTRLLERCRLTLSDIALLEINEAFASVLAVWQRELGASLDNVNVNGGAIALGHPLGCSGARLLTSLLHELERSKQKLGLVAMCCRGGLGTGTLIQAL